MLLLLLWPSRLREAAFTPQGHVFDYGGLRLKFWYHSMVGMGSVDSVLHSS